MEFSEDFYKCLKELERAAEEYDSNPFLWPNFMVIPDESIMRN